jgi:hypothetical protein
MADQLGPRPYPQGSECPHCGYLLTEDSLCTHCNWAAPFQVDLFSRGEASKVIDLGAAAFRAGYPMVPPENISVFHQNWWCLGWQDAEMEARNQRGEL